MCERKDSIWISKLRKCNCRSGFYLDAASDTCLKCRCTYFDQVCRDSATDCGTRSAFWTLTLDNGKQISDAASVEGGRVIFLGGGEVNIYQLKLREKSASLLSTYFDQKKLYTGDETVTAVSYHQSYIGSLGTFPEFYLWSTYTG